MKTLLLTFGLGLITALQAQDPTASDEKNQDLSGTWYLKAVTADKEILKQKPEYVAPVSLTILEGGNLEVKYSIPKADQCQDVKVVLEKTDEPGKYTIDGGKHVVYITGSRVKDHFLIYCEGELQGQQIHVLKLMGRDPEDNQEAMEDFEQAAAARGHPYMERGERAVATISVGVDPPSYSPWRSACFPFPSAP
ncbi:PREDICTED: lipocalin-1, partial [Galeopterus variegatus]|uniref:Lipocalin-1 n=1 Tax=Galeopterus variegatus TaxID=482537 RepID=A0ABM0SIE9_GALVR